MDTRDPEDGDMSETTEVDIYNTISDKVSDIDQAARDRRVSAMSDEPPVGRRKLCLYSF